MGIKQTDMSLEFSCMHIFYCIYINQEQWKLRKRLSVRIFSISRGAICTLAQLGPKLFVNNCHLRIFHPVSTELSHSLSWNYFQFVHIRPLDVRNRSFLYPLQLELHGEITRTPAIEVNQVLGWFNWRAVTGLLYVKYCLSEYRPLAKSFTIKYL